MFEDAERGYLERASLGRLATADAEANPHVIPVCFALDGERVVSAIDEKPQRVAPTDLRRVRDVESNPQVALVVDHYSEEWADLGWVQIRGTATVLDPGADGHAAGVTRLERKYPQYDSQDLGSRPLLSIEPGSVRSWGRLDRPE